MTGTGKYRTIVADPPWDVTAKRAGTDHLGRATSMPYPTLSISDIELIHVWRVLDDDAVLYLWAVGSILNEAYRVAAAWSFRVAQVLVWSKKPKGIVGGDYVGSAEFILYCKHGWPKANSKHMGSVFEWPRSEHSAKPEAFLDHVEQMHPGPYLELFARRARFGWDYWGDESLGTVEMTQP